MVSDKGHELIRKNKCAGAEMRSDTVVCGQNTEACENTCFSVTDILLLETQTGVDVLPDICTCHHIPCLVRLCS